MSPSPRSVSLSIVPDPNASPTRHFAALAWYPGIRVLDLLVLADASLTDSFTFRAIYGSQYGVFIDQFDGIADAPDRFWLLYIDGQLAERGVSESLIIRDGSHVEFRFEVPPKEHSQSTAKLALASMLSKA
ncbi:hypothetical protein [Acuticoccus sp.]|uniref:hypothetical protein n=1 Tax=Acuticoccus sp. TaxID=1904378 RepID=UPI003B519433